MGRIIIARRKGLHGVEATHTTLADGSLRTTGHDHVGLAEAQQVESVGQRIGRRGTGAGGGEVGSVEAEVDADLSSGDVGDHLRDEERREAGTFLLVESVVGSLLLKRLDTADTYTIDHADAVLIDLVEVEAAVLHTLHGTGHGQLCVAVHLAGVLAVDPLVGIPVFHLTGKLGLEVGGVEQRNRSCAAHTLDHVLPSLLGSVSQRGDSAETRYDNSFQFHVYSVLSIDENVYWAPCGAYSVVSSEFALSRAIHT